MNRSTSTFRSMAHLRHTILRFLQREQGMESLQVVMIIAIAAVCLIAVKVFWSELASWTRELLDVFFEV